MLRISKLADYGTVIMAYMAQGSRRTFSAADIAEELHLSPPTVSKILKMLARGGLLSATRGSQGGYALARPANAISIAEIIDVMEEQPFGLTECSSLSGRCAQESLCNVRANWMRINHAVRLALEGVKLIDLTRPQPVAFHAPLPATRIEQHMEEQQ